MLTHAQARVSASQREADMYHRELGSALCGDLERWGGEGVGRRLMRERIHIPVSDSHCSMAETHTAL